MVVPPGLVTISLSSPGCFPVSSTMVAAPRTVCAARRSATWRGRPARTAPSASASMKLNTKAGPEPETPVTASRSFSFTSMTSPTAPKTVSTLALSSSVAAGPHAYAAALSPTMQGVLGMTRTMRVASGKQAAMASMGTPAAMLTMQWFGVRCGASSLRTMGTTSGFTATMMRFARLATSALPPLKHCTPGRSSLSLSSSGCTRSLAHTRAAGMAPALTAPRARAPAMLPAPMKPNMPSSWRVGVDIDVVPESRLTASCARGWVGGGG
mmetsp:Transcript_20047/g.60740  ORF Transcript_20047/g.60740 Transcript_20047/m.60740 type:complete len:268 (-) Transcript_20047:304-1107(-)